VQALAVHLARQSAEPSQAGNIAADIYDELAGVYGPDQRAKGMSAYTEHNPEVSFVAT
jgi:hypothetical protein